MRARSHAIIASVLALVGVFFLEKLLMIGMIFIPVATIEVVMAVRRRRTGADVWETSRQRLVRKLGISTLVIGVVLAVYGLFELSNTMVSCPASGCTAAELWRIYGVYEISFYLGGFMAVIGPALFLVAAFMGVKIERWRKEVRVSAKAMP